MTVSHQTPGAQWPGLLGRTGQAPSWRLGRDSCWDCSEAGGTFSPFPGGHGEAGSRATGSDKTGLPADFHWRAKPPSVHVLKSHAGRLETWLCVRARVKAARGVGRGDTGKVVPSRTPSALDSQMKGGRGGRGRSVVWGDRDQTGRACEGRRPQRSLSGNPGHPTTPRGRLLGVQLEGPRQGVLAELWMPLRHWRDQRAAQPGLHVRACPGSQGKFDVPPPAPQTREQLQAEAQRAQTRIEDLERALAEQGQVGTAWATRGTWDPTRGGVLPCRPSWAL